jgi:hypothetical protein
MVVCVGISLCLVSSLKMSCAKSSGGAGVMLNRIWP